VGTGADLPDDLSFEALARELERPVGQFLTQMMADRSLAADLMQESFLAAWRDRTRMPSDERARRAWMYGIARNRALDALRKQRRGATAWRRLSIQRADPGAEESEALAVRDLLVRTLSPEDRSLFVLRYVHGFEAAELAQLTGLKPEAVRKRLQRASERLASAYEGSRQKEDVRADVCI
jgi:RNA polymerase sigma-70 factor (ECF subfamily)